MRGGRGQEECGEVKEEESIIVVGIAGIDHTMEEYRNFADLMVDNGAKIRYRLGR